MNPPTATERQGLEAAIVGRIIANGEGRTDPVAMLGYGPGVIDWEHGITSDNSSLNTLGQYMNPNHPLNLRGYRG